MEPAGVSLTECDEALVDGAASLAWAPRRTIAAAGRTHGADPLPERSLTGRACLIVVQAFPIG